MQTSGDEWLWWSAAGPENLWNGPGDGLDQLDIIDAALVGIPDGQVIDLGCGNGRLLARMAERHPARGFLGLDIWSRPYGYPMPPNATTASNDGRTIPLPSGGCAAVYSVLLFQHLPSDAVQCYLMEAARVLKPGGVLAFQAVVGPGDPDGFLHYRYQANDLLDWCQQAGFPVVAGAEALQPDWYWVTATRGSR